MTKITENWLTLDAGGSLANYSAWDVLVPVGGGGTGPVAQDSVLFSRAAVTVLKVATANEPIGANQEFEAVVAGLSNLDGNSVSLWCRFDETVDYNPDIATTGYGLSLLWNTDGTRKMGLLKINKATKAIEDMGTVTVVLKDGTGDADLGANQIIRLVVVTLPDDRVLLRGYLNEDDDGEPTIEAVDVGRSVTGASSTVHRGAGTYAITLGGTTTVMIDSVTMRDDYVLSAFGDFQVGYRTLSALRTELIRSTERGATSSLDSEYLNILINQTVKAVMNEIEDIAQFSRKMRVFALAEDTDKLVEMPYDVDRVLEIYDRDTRLPVQWKVVNTTSNNRLSVTISPPPAGRDYQVDYIEKWEPMSLDTDLCVIPEKFDEVVIAGASVRLARADRDRRFTAAMEATYAQVLRAMKIALNSQLRGHRGVLHVVANRSHAYTRYGAAWQHIGPF